MTGSLFLGEYPEYPEYPDCRIIHIHRMTKSKDDNQERFRIDKWLCAARFYKTRSLAADAVEGGHVHVNELRVKLAKAVALGDMLDIRIGQKQFVVEVLALSNRRGPASEAQKLYRETDESRQRRETIAAQLREQPRPFRFRGRPTKRDRREIERYKQGK